MRNVDGNKYIILNPNHRLDMAGSNTIKQEFTSLLGKNYNLWIIDMAKVEFVDSSGLSALVVGLKTARKHGYSLVICNLNPTVKLAFEITQLDSVFPIFNTFDDIFLDDSSKLAIA
ncbi:MAG: STAS domain-containing protein [Trichodesmium sp.]